MGSVMVLSVAAWASMPVVFGLSWYHCTISLYAFVILKFVTLSISQYVVRNRITAKIAETRPNLHKAMVSRQQATQTWQVSGVTVCGVLASILANMWNFVVCILAALESIDPDLDAMTPGQVRKAFRAEDDRSFARSYEHVPIVGPIMSSVRLPTALIVALTVVAAWQIYLFASRISFAWTHLYSKSWIQFVSTLYNAADVAGCHILSWHLKEVWMAADEVAAAAWGSSRAPRYSAVVPELVLSAWLTSSAVAIIDDENMSRTAPIYFSLCTSFVTSLKLFCDIASVFLPYARLTLIRYPDDGWCRIVRTCIAMAFHVVGYAFITTHLISVFICSRQAF